MNDITVLDVLSLPIMSNAKLRAGHNGLSNKIQYVNILDNRYDDTDTSSQLPKYGENFYITSMYYGKDDAAYIASVVQHFIDVKAAAVCIIDEYIDKLPEEVYALCNEHRLPIIFVDKETPYPIIISSIMELKLSYQKAQKMEALFYELTRPGCDEEQVKEILKQIHPGFANHIAAFHCQNVGEGRQKITDISNQLKLISMMNSRPLTFASEYREGILILQSFKEASSKMEGDIVEKLVAEIQCLLPKAAIGISALHPLLEIGQAISEADTALMSGAGNVQGVMHYEKLGPIRLIMELQGKPQLEAYYREIFDPIDVYDQKYRSHLLDTIVSFVENNMDYIKTSKAMFVHENTVRYRLSKVKNMIPYGNCDMDFQQTLYLFYKIMKLKEFN